MSAQDRGAEVHRLLPRATTDELVLDRLFASAPIGLGFLDRRLRYRRVNEALAAINGVPAAEHIGRRPSELLGERGVQAEAMLERVMATGEPLLDAEFALPDGRHLIVSYVAVTRDDGEVVGTLGVLRDITPRKEVELDLERALDHSTRLQQVSASLSAALTVDEVAAVVVRACMEVLDGTCGVLALRGTSDLEIRHRFGMPGGAPTVLPLGARMPLPEAVRERRIVSVRSRDEWLARYAAPPRGDFAAFVAAPLMFEGRATGCMGIGLPDTRVPDDRELALIGAIGRQGAQALDRARLYEERAYVAATLQRGLLPPSLPSVEGMEVSVMYRPVGDGSEVGGDFYDVSDLGDSSWLVALGDVAGKGAPAAVLSGLVRSTLSALARREDSPADLLAMANRAILRHTSGRHEYATAVCAILTRVPGGVSARVGSAGHPPALVVRARGEVEVLGSHGILLGATEDPDVREITTLLEPGDTLVVHTDGITDARLGGERFGEERLRAALARVAGRSAAEVTAAVEAAVAAFQAGPPPDDAALLALRAL